MKANGSLLQASANRQISNLTPAEDRSSSMSALRGILPVMLFAKCRGQRPESHWQRLEVALSLFLSWPDLRGTLPI